jgi:ribonuclease G
MPKEMIISVNGREKKIAIIDNGRVTEFYIERGEENAGVVGNIYKGKVQRVLPGMQSAFVDIGLERDAFLYVSDFFDEEEELERIVQEKSKKASAEEARNEAKDTIERQRVEREKQIESAQEKADSISEDGTAIATESEEGTGRRRGRRGRGRGKDRGRGPSDRSATNPREAAASGVRSEFSIELEDSNFERVVDDSEAGADFKDAHRQETIVNQVRAAEFDLDSAGEAKVGTLMGSMGSDTRFERVADEDDTESTSTPKKKRSLWDIFRSKDEEPEQKNSDDDSLEDGEASVKEPRDTAEMAVRRGGRGGRGRRRKKSSGDASVKSEERFEGAEMDEAVSAEEELADAELEFNESSPTDEGALEAISDDSAPAQEGESELQEDAATEEVSEGKPKSPRAKKGRSPRERRGRSSDRKDRPQAAIADLLKEGQEIIVQIAKEPIARKGARITSHIALPGRYLVYMPTIEHLGVSRKIESSNERARLRAFIQNIRKEEDIPSGGFIVRTAGVGVPESNLRDDARYLVKTWQDIKKNSENRKSPAMVHQDLDLIQRLLRDQLSDDFSAIRIDNEEEYLRVADFVSRIQPKMVNRVKLYTRETPILEAYGVQDEIEKALRPRVWLKSGGYLVINQTEALVAIDVNTGKFVGKGNARLEDTITKTNLEAVEEIARQIRLRDLGGIIVLDLIDMEDRRNRQKVLSALQEHLHNDKSPTKVLSFNDFGLIIMTRKRVKQSLERTLCAPCEYCQGAGWVKSAQTVCFEILEEARRLSRSMKDVRHITLRVNPEVATALHGAESEVLEEIESYLGAIDITSDPTTHQAQFDFAFV